MRPTTDPLVRERHQRMYGHPSSVAHREAARPAAETPESRLRHRQADEKAALVEKHRDAFGELTRKQDHENIDQHRKGVQFPAATNSDRHARERRGLLDQHQREREQLAERHREQQRARLRAEQRG